MLEKEYIMSLECRYSINVYGKDEHIAGKFKCTHFLVIE